MQKRVYKNIKKMLPYVGFSVIAGFLSAILGTVFKLGAEGIIHLSGTIYGTVRQNPIWLPLLVVGAAAVGLVASGIVSRADSCKGGGIPTSVAAVRGMVRFRWLVSVLVLPFSALLTFFCGLPLGTEGPCVQMGTAIGDGVIRCVGSEKHRGWRRYVMTGGASAGFSVATASPISAVVFSVEELHKHFSPLLLVGVSISVMTAQITVQILSLFGIGSDILFQLPEILTISPRFFFAPLIVGIVCGLCSVVFTRFYHIMENMVRTILKRLSIKIMFLVLFACTALVGFFLSDTLGTGHALVDKLFDTHFAWYLLLLVFFVRAVFMMTANTSGATGGVFLPTLAFGAMVGSLCADGMIALGWLEPGHGTLMVILGITAFLGATSRIPLTACVFAVEALSGIHNILAILMATTVAFLIAELSGVEDFTDTVIEAKLNSIRKGSEPTVAETSLTVGENSFAAGKELRDILWPDSCTVISVEHVQGSHHHAGLNPGDVVTVRYRTHTPTVTAEELTALLGDQIQQM